MQKNGRIKLGDFGIANVLASTDPNRKKKKVTGGTLPYASPEAFTGEEASYAGDIWAVGCMLREMITGEVAFLRPTRSAIELSVRKEFLCRLPKDYSRELRAIIW